MSYNVQCEAYSMNFYINYYAKFTYLALWMDFFNNHASENSGSLEQANFPNIDTFHCRCLKLQFLVLWQISWKKYLSISYQVHCNSCGLEMFPLKWQAFFIPWGKRLTKYPTLNYPGKGNLTWGTGFITLVYGHNYGGIFLIKCLM